MVREHILLGSSCFVPRLHPRLLTRKLGIPDAQSTPGPHTPTLPSLCVLSFEAGERPRSADVCRTRVGRVSHVCAMYAARIYDVCRTYAGRMWLKRGASTPVPGTGPWAHLAYTEQ